MDSTYYIHDTGNEPRPVVLQTLQQQLELQQLQQQQQQQQQQQKRPSAAAAAPLLGPSDARDYLVSPPPLSYEQQQQQQQAQQHQQQHQQQQQHISSFNISYGDSNYRNKTLKLSFEASASSLFRKETLNKFEASDIVAYKDSLYFSGIFYIVREAVTHNPDQEDAEAPEETEGEQQHQQEQQQQQQLEKQQQEEKQRLQQQERSSTKPFHAHIEEITVHGDSYTLHTTCKTG
ncbi:hypothetical protein, conserved [Eimeria maxima]|uniref:Uncharacterized protein n=1 Tax=Eimeria maxima TaxID=5804 RepID=U6MDJ3_EIMMA|nr:hypothetical protein, conserved [Eimeria maxima]CDJ61123.1 hypothetical protein, conserved [Eimeria maxima]